ncbi:hypothetical protein F0562_005839 [Nyssa sinensis]|uniref:glycerophosphodiester phosphodiesterase n=1 Tax=Nyssa sinensis TaxID=561372 RepID=A0A5J5AKF7_9ASTE|nr:hypothetical protein F0562_005839 [Nyssa sinensis]
MPHTWHQRRVLGITDAVATALSNATFDKQSSQQVLIQSDDSSVLSKFSNVPTYKRVLSITETFSDAPKQAVEEIKKFADAVILRKNSIIPTSNFFTRPTTSVLEDLHMANLSVYVSVFKNEFVSMAFDYLSDPMAELATFVGGYKVDGIVTEYPATASTYMRSQCADPNAKLDYGIVTSQPGDLINLIQPEALPPAEAPAPALDVSYVVDPPLPPVAKVSNDSASDAGAAPAPQKSSQTAKVANVGLSLVAIVVLSLLSMGY